MQRRAPLFSLLLAGAAAMAVFGCRDTATPATVAGPAAAAAPSFDYGRHADREHEDDYGEHGSPHLLACTAHGSTSITATVGASGAALQVGHDHLVIPGGALSESVQITATIPADTLADIELEPHGLHFSKDVMLVLSADGCRVGEHAPRHVDYLDAAGNVLETLDATFNGGSHTVTTKIHHFSSYAIAL
jgi:hypothetical protein